MTTDLLVPVDGSPLSIRALEFACESADDSSIVALHVLDPSDPGYSSATDIDTRTEPRHGSDAWYERANDEEERIFDASREVVAEYDVDFSTDSTTGEPAREIVAYAEEHDIDHIVMGSHGRTGPTRSLLGSVAEMVVRRSPTAVTVVRELDD
ncbi:universal stress protein [Salinadaptatus halalkaliphilus]|uniref:Universal stress protein n=1 Tax=Salinadaptatus halalkaliphilus TaxID=2419781 RepID=A0A4S3THR5_9EURY|nr:universal stress protein [Salinadaptatus halalkaliphilus]THE63442.1 universal stress protein [Salinadaptatus halalkaliphilus]